MANYTGFSGDHNDYNALLNQCVTSGSSPIGAVLALVGSASPISRLMTILRVVTDGEHPEMTPQGYTIFSLFVAKDNEVRAGLGNLNEMTLVAGMLTARWRLSSTNPPIAADVQAIWDQLSSRIKPRLNTHTALLRDAIANMRTLIMNSWVWGTNPADTAQTSVYISGVITGVTGVPEKIITALEGGSVPWTKLGYSIAAIRAATSNQTLSDVFNAELAANWYADLSSEEIMSVCNFVGRHQSNVVRPMVMRSVFISLAAICKGTNLTANWAKSRWEALKQQYEAINVGGQDVTREVVQEYTKNFIGNSVNVGALYGAMIFNHHLGTALNVDGLNWMIEQARGANVTGLSAIASAVTQYDMCTYTILRKIIPATNFDQACTGMVHTIRQPYITLHGPVVAVVKYADLALVGVLLTMSDGNDAMIKSLRGKSSVETSKLNTLVDMIKRCQEEGTAMLLGTQVIIDAYNINAVASPEGICQVLAYDDMGAAEVVNAGEQALVRRNLASLTSNDLNELRPHLKKYHIRDIIRKGNNSRDSAFKTICDHFMSAISQDVLDDQDLQVGNNNGYQPRNLPQAVATAMNELGIGEVEPRIITVIPIARPNEPVLHPFPAAEQ